MKTIVLHLSYFPGKILFTILFVISINMYYYVSIDQLSKLFEFSIARYFSDFDAEFWPVPCRI